VGVVCRSTTPIPALIATLLYIYLIKNKYIQSESEPWNFHPTLEFYQDSNVEEKILKILSE